MRLLNLKHSSFLRRREFDQSVFAEYVAKKGGEKSGTMARNHVGGDK